MPKKIINESITVVRDGKRVSPEIGKPFDLTDDEIKQLKAIRPQAFSNLAKYVEDKPAETAPTSGAGGSADLDDVDLTKMDRAQLLDLATGMELEFAKNISTEKLIAQIESARGAEGL